jgi:3-oxoacyl-[acyl-carrier-protein] synthase-3
VTALRVPSGPAGSRILGVGAYRPVYEVGNEEVCRLINSSDEWVRTRSGIVSRRFAGDDETVVSMGAEAAVKAMAQAGVDPSSIGMVLLASMSYLYQSPAAAPQIAAMIGAHAAAATDVGAACAGFCYALALADSLVRSGATEHVLVIGSERMSDIIDPTDRGTAFLFGDGAGAVVVGPSTTPEIGPVVWGSDGTRHRLIGHDRTWQEARQCAHPWPAMRMAGPEVFRWATRCVPAIARQALSAAGIGIDDLAAFIPHQANARIIDAAAKSLRLSERTVIARDVVTAGNTSAASIPLAVDALLAHESLSGRPALLVGFGAGLVYAAQVVTLP